MQVYLDAAQGSQLSSLRVLTPGGEVLNPATVKKAKQLVPGIRIFNAYGIVACDAALHLTWNLPRHRLISEVHLEHLLWQSLKL